MTPGLISTFFVKKFLTQTAIIIQSKSQHSQEYQRTILRRVAVDLQEAQSRALSAVSGEYSLIQQLDHSIRFSVG